MEQEREFHVYTNNLIRVNAWFILIKVSITTRWNQYRYRSRLRFLAGYYLDVDFDWHWKKTVHLINFMTACKVISWECRWLYMQCTARWHRIVLRPGSTRWNNLAFWFEHNLSLCVFRHVCCLSAKHNIMCEYLSYRLILATSLLCMILKHIRLTALVRSNKVKNTEASTRIKESQSWVEKKGRWRWQWRKKRGGKRVHEETVQRAGQPFRFVPLSHIKSANVHCKSKGARSLWS